jgi:hypothetical protein
MKTPKYVKVGNKKITIVKTLFFTIWFDILPNCAFVEKMPLKFDKGLLEHHP